VWQRHVHIIDLLVDLLVYRQRNDEQLDDSSDGRLGVLEASGNFRVDVGAEASDEARNALLM